MRSNLTRTNLLARAVPWIVGVAYAIHGGWKLPQSQEALNFPSGPLGIVLAMVPGIACAISALFPYRPSRLPGASLEAGIDKLFGPGYYRHAVLALGFAAWVGVCTVVVGTLGLARAVALSGGESVYLMSLFFLNGGTGTLFLFKMQRARYVATRDGA